MVELAVVLGLVLVNGLFAGAEIALLSVRETRVRELVDEGRRGASSVADLRAHPERLLATVQIGITVVGATAAAFGGSSIAAHLAPAIAPWLGGERADLVAFAIVVGGISYLSLVLGELVPKSLALRAAEPYALLVSPALAAVAWLARPLVWALTGSSNLVLRLFGDSTSFIEARMSFDELRQLVGEASTAGTRFEHAGAIASRALEFSELTVADVLVPRSRVVSVPRDASPAQVAAVLAERDHGRLLVYGDDPDDLLGYVKVRQVLAQAVLGGPVSLVDHLLPAPIVPLTMPAPSLLRHLQAHRANLAVAVDELGTVRGIVSLEDLVEELIGDVLSEREPPHPGVRAEGEGWWVEAALPVREVNRAIGVGLPEPDEASTLGGLVLEVAGHIPAVGARFTLGAFDVEVIAATRRKIIAVRLTPRSAPDLTG